MKQVICLGIMLGMLTSLGSARAEQSSPPAAVDEASMLEAIEYSELLGMKGFSDVLLKDHFKLYEGYVKNTNAVMGRIHELLAEGKDRTPEYAELKRRAGWEFDGMLLHEYYFENLGKGELPIDPKSALYEQIVESFGSFDAWKKDFVSTGLMRGIGWVVFCREPRTRKLVNVWINEHDLGHISGAKPLLVMDVFEHAYMPDYQLDKAAYIGNFFNNINWDTVTERFDQ